MVILLVKVQIKPEKRREFVQSARGLAALQGELFQVVDDENRLLLVEHWASELEAEEYTASDKYRALRGALNTLCERSELEWVRGEVGDEALIARNLGYNREVR